MRRALALVLGVGVAAVPAQAQNAVTRLAGGAVYRSFTLDPSLNAQSASLLLVPVAADLALGRALGLELYAAWASGSIERNDRTLRLEGPVNANVRAVWAATPWARVSVGVSVPTADAGRDADEAQVAATLSTDLLGFREASFGTGLAVTTGVAFAHRVGAWGLGYGGSYRLAGEFEPIADSAVTYAPGSQLALRVAADRNLGSSGKLTLGASVQHFQEDDFGANLFRPGIRVRGDVAYGFRTGATSTWTVYAVDIWRERSDATLGGGPTPVDTAVLGAQNVVVLGFVGAVAPGGFQLQPSADVRLLSRDDGVAGGWLASAGSAVPIRLGSIQFVPRAVALFGAIEAAGGDRPAISGLEIELRVRWGSGIAF